MRAAVMPMLAACWNTLSTLSFWLAAGTAANTQARAHSTGSRRRGTNNSQVLQLDVDKLQREYVLSLWQQ